MAIHVSIHDVSPAWADEVELALDYAARVGIKPALLVVPNFHGRHPLGEASGFCERLRALQRDGHEIYLHGFYHESRSTRESSEYGLDGRPGRWAWLFAQRVASGGEAEFSDVTRAEAVARLDEGEKVLADAGLAIDGFVAPAWSMAPWLLPILAARRYGFCEDHTTIYEPATGRQKPSVVLNYASRTPARLLSTVAYCRVAKYARALVPARIAIHPADMRFSLLRHEVRHLVAWAEGDVVARSADLFEAAAAAS